MAKQIQLFNFSGMQRDVSVSKHPAQFLYDARNIRLTARGSDTLLSVTNEKGTKDLGIEIPGTYLGHCLLNNYLVVFSTDGQDHITRIDLSFEEQDTVLSLYKGNLGFAVDKPITAIASYENEDIQKVYWTDGEEQPRMINIVASAEQREKYNDTYFDFVATLQLQENIKVKKMLGASGQFAPGVIQYAFTYYRKYSQESSIFYTTPLLYISHKDRGASPEDKVENAFQITVENIDPNFDFLRIYSIHRTSLNATPFCRRVQDIPLNDLGYYLEAESVTIATSTTTPFIKGNGWTQSVYTFGNYTYHEERNIAGVGTFECFGISKEDNPNLVLLTSEGKVTWGDASTNSSVMWVTVPTGYNQNKNYNIAVTPSYTNTTGLQPFKKSVLVKGAITYIDNGYSGDTVDPTELLFKGGEVISAKTIEQKDGTLFLGGLTITRPQIVDSGSDYLKSSIEKVVTYPVFRTLYFPENFLKQDSSYAYANQLTVFGDKEKTESVPCSGFKSGDYYRLGLQFQYKTGRWSEPIFINNGADVSTTNRPSLTTDTEGNDIVELPCFMAYISPFISNSLLQREYLRVRPVVVFPQLQDRIVLCQGVANPTLYTKQHRDTDKDIYAQSSWFFRPLYNVTGSWSVENNGEVFPASRNILPYATSSTTYNPSNIKAVEIQGDFEGEGDSKKFKVDTSFVTFHSPEIEFDTNIYNESFIGFTGKQVGNVDFIHTFADIDIQTETPTISTIGSGFVHHSFSSARSYGIVSGLFYDDSIVDDLGTDEPLPFRAYDKLGSSVKWMVYLWNKNGSLNNDLNRPSNAGSPSAKLKRKVVSNLRYTATKWDVNTKLTDLSDLDLFSSEEPTIIKLKSNSSNFYMGNIDTVLVPNKADGLYFAFNGGSITTDTQVSTPFTKKIEWKTFATSSFGIKNGIWKYSSIWERTGDDSDATDIGDNYPELVIKKEGVRMKYKSSPHLIFRSDLLNYSIDKLPIVEILKEEINTELLFGGKTDDALKANQWVPCGKSVPLNPTGETKVLFEYGDTYYQRYDCLKTYAFTPEDINQVVEIGSFMLETHVNIDGRYDRNRGQLSNINMSPRNFNLINPVYSQVDNFFTYRMLNEDYYNISSFPNQITWTKEKFSGAETDLWSNITLASTYDLDGSKGKITSLNTWRDKIFCFQQKGVSEVLFNSRVQIPTSDNNPIEISNNYKVDGYRYLSEGIGCNDQRQIKETPATIYFIDSVGNHLYSLGEGFGDVSQAHNMSSWATVANIGKLCYDEVNKDLYQIGLTTALCFSEILNQFTSFMDYNQVSLIESYKQRVFTMKDGKLYAMFEGDYCDFFGVPKPYYMTLVSNENSQLDKIFTNMEFRACVEGDGEYDVNTGKFTPTLPFDSLETWNEYQKGKMTLEYKNGLDRSLHHGSATSEHLDRRFRLWRCDIPRDNARKLSASIFTTAFDKSFYTTRSTTHPNDRMRNPWLFIKFTKLAGTIDAPLKGTEIHDMMVTYFT